MSQINIITNTNKVDVTTLNNQVVVTNPNNSATVNITQPVTTIVEVSSPGPQGPPGAGATINTGSFATTGSNNFKGNQIVSGSITLAGGSKITNENDYVSIDIQAGTGGYVELLSNNQSSSFILTDQNVVIATSGGAWIFGEDGTTSYPANVIAASFTGSLQGTASYATSVGTLNQDVSITGNLNVIGTSSFTYTTASIVQVGASTIILNTNNPATRFGGITVVDSGSFGNSSTGSLLWDSLNNRWIYSNPSGSSYDGGMLISGPRNTSGIGNEAGMDANYLAVGAGGDHIQPSTIYNSGSGASAITLVTGSLSVSNGITGSLLGSASYADTVGESDIDYLMLQSFRLTYNY